MIAQKLKRENNLDYSADEEILVTNGANHALSLILDTFVNKGDGVVVFDPSYMMFSYMAQLKQAKLRWVPTSFDHGYTKFDTHALDRALAGAKAIYIACMLYTIVPAIRG